uniref:Uncharacterized protein n=1 Tax=Caenorhabditis japonica TaxID=281687 RepID=A0A8R1IRB1_CAEJA
MERVLAYTVGHLQWSQSTRSFRLDGLKTPAANRFVRVHTVLDRRIGIRGGRMSLSLALIPNTTTSLSLLSTVYHVSQMGSDAQKPYNIPRTCNFP